MILLRTLVTARKMVVVTRPEHEAVRTRTLHVRKRPEDLKPRNKQAKQDTNRRPFCEPLIPARCSKVIDSPSAIHGYASRYARLCTQVVDATSLWQQQQPCPPLMFLPVGLLGRSVHLGLALAVLGPLLEQVPRCPAWARCKDALQRLCRRGPVDRLFDDAADVRGQLRRIRGSQKGRRLVSCFACLFLGFRSSGRVTTTIFLAVTSVLRRIIRGLLKHMTVAIS